MSKTIHNKLMSVLIILSIILLYSGCINITFAYDENARTFTFSDTAITDNGTGDTEYSYSGTDLKINNSGTYVVTGNCSNGSITVKKGSENVNLILKDLTLSNETTAPISIAKNTQVNIVIEGNVILEDNILNAEKYLVDKGYATYNTAEDKYYCTDSGASVLNLSSGDEVKAENAVIKTKGNSKVNISGTGVLNITTNSKNGIKAGATLDGNGNDIIGDSSLSYLILEGITLNIDATNAYKATNDDTYGDGINAASYLAIKSGTYNISSGDDAIECDFVLDIGNENDKSDKPIINIPRCFEGIEGSIINIYNGDIDILSSDDCINAANGDILDPTNSYIYNRYYQFAINIFDGNIRGVAGINSNNKEGDVLDSNGNILIEDGKVFAFGAENGNAFDTGQDDNKNVDDSLVIVGGTVLGLGNSSLAITPTVDSQSWVSWGIRNQGNPGAPRLGNLEQSNQYNNPSLAPANTNATNMTNVDNIKLLVNNNRYSVGSNVNIVKNRAFSILYDSESIFDEVSQNNAYSLLFSSSLLDDPSSGNTDNNGNNDNIGNEDNTGTNDNTGNNDNTGDTGNTGDNFGNTDNNGNTDNPGNNDNIGNNDNTGNNNGTGTDNTDNSGNTDNNNTDNPGNNNNPDNNTGNTDNPDTNNNNNNNNTDNNNNVDNNNNSTENPSDNNTDNPIDNNTNPGDSTPSNDSDTPTDQETSENSSDDTVVDESDVTDDDVVSEENIEEEDEIITDGDNIKDNNNSTVKTGDETYINLYILILIISSITLISLIIYNKKERN